MPNLFAGFEEVVQENVPLAPLTWYKLGGPARYLVRPQDPDQLRALSRRCMENGTRVLVLGLGANLLVADEGVNAAVFKLDAPYWEKFTAEKSHLFAGAGADMQAVARFCVRHGLAGLECMAGIPGTIGGCVRGNAGGKFGEIGSGVSRVRVMSVDGEIFDRTRDDLIFSYRHSNIAATFILSAEFDMEEEDPDSLVKHFKEIWMFKKNSQPLNTKNAGCVFKNPVELGKSAGALIDQAGLKGTRVGLAEVSPKHANFIVAHPGCTATDIRNLIDLVKNTVATTHGIELEEELVIWK
jgi:UDP-N-acetylmuramate dehydrogenase